GDQPKAGGGAQASIPDLRGPDYPARASPPRRFASWSPSPFRGDLNYSATRNSSQMRQRNCGGPWPSQTALRSRPHGLEELHLLRMPVEDFDQAHGGVVRRHRPALVFLERPAPAADQPPGFLLRQPEPLANVADVGGIGGLQF